MDEMHPWRRLGVFLPEALHMLRRATRTSAEIAHHFEAAGFIDHAVSALSDPSPWPASSVAAGAAKLLAGATGDGVPPLFESIQTVMKLMYYLHIGGRFLGILRDGLQELRDTHPRYEEIPVDFGVLEVYDDICSMIEPIGVRIRRAIRELRLAEGHYLYIRELIRQLPFHSGAITEAETHARQAHRSIHDALTYISTINDMLNYEPPEASSFFGGH